MDPNPSRFPILSYVMSKLPSIGGAASRHAAESEYDIEQPQAAAKKPAEVEMQLPQITDPEVLKKLNVLIGHVSQAREVLEALGERPDHESVDLAREKVREIQTKLDEMSADVADDADVEWKKRKEEVEKERELYKSIIVVDEMHEEYEKLLRESEEKLVRIFDEQRGGGEGKGKEKMEEDIGAEVSEEVVRVLQEAEAGREVEKVDLAGRQLKVLPEAFGRIKGLVVLNLANNQLQVN